MSYFSKQLICGACNCPASAHTSDDNVVARVFGLNIECFREFHEIGQSFWQSEQTGQEVSDYWLIDGVVVTPQDLEGTESLILAYMERSEDEFLQEDWSAEFAKLDRWNDRTHRVTAQGTKSWVSTSTLGEEPGEYLLTQDSDKGRTKAKYDTNADFLQEQRNAFVEGNPGFLSLELYNTLLTERYQNHLLNVFRDKQTSGLRVGSVKFIHYADGTIQAACVRNDCSGRSAVMDPSSATREDMETFIWACIVHGNNHAAKWFTSRPEFYPLNTELSEPVLTEDEQYAFLKDHSVHCSDSKCEHQSRLEELRPDLHRKELQLS